MRPSFIADYLKEQAERKIKSVARKNAVRDRKRKTEKKHGRCCSVQPRTELHLEVKRLLGKSVITRHTSFHDSLSLLGFSSYRLYLRSPLWRLVRERVFQVKGRACFLCADGATVVHHRKYTGLTLIGEDINSLCPICEGCHRAIEFDFDGKKLATDDVEEYVIRHLSQDELRNDELSSEFINMVRGW